MSLGIFVQGFMIATFFSLAFMLGGYISFKLIHTQHKKDISFFKENIDTTDQFNDKLKKLTIRLSASKNKNMDILALYDKFFAEILIEASKEMSFENKELAAIYFEDYISRRKKLDESV